MSTEPTPKMFYEKLFSDFGEFAVKALDTHPEPLSLCLVVTWNSAASNAQPATMVSRIPDDDATDQVICTYIKQLQRAIDRLQETRIKRAVKTEVAKALSRQDND